MGSRLIGMFTTKPGLYLRAAARRNYTVRTTFGVMPKHPHIQELRRFSSGT